MKTVLKNIITNRVVIITVIGCLLIIGCLKVIDQITEDKEVTDTQAEFGPIAGNSHVPYTYPPFAEPSLEKLVAELKVELGVQDADINVEEVAAANTLYTLNYMDSRLPPEEVIAAWTERKKLVIANPELLWTPGFTLPPYVIPPGDVRKWGRGAHFGGQLYDYEFRYGVDFTNTEEQLERIYAVRDQAQKGEIPSEEARRKRGKILVERLDLLSAAKYFLNNGGVGTVELELGREYAERAFSENPDSVEALHIWVLCHDTQEQWETGFRRMLDEFPNSAIAHSGLAGVLCRRLSRPEEGLLHIQKAIQLDSRIPRYNYLLAECYREAGEHEKALAVYQGMSIIESHVLHDYFVESQINAYALRMQNENGDTTAVE